MENQAISKTENVVQLHEIITLRIERKCACGAVNYELNNEKFLKLNNKPKIEETFYVISKKINEIKGLDNIFLAYNKIKINPLNVRKIKLRMRKYFA